MDRQIMRLTETSWNSSKLVATVSHRYVALWRTWEPFVFAFFTSTFLISRYNRWPII